MYERYFMLKNLYKDYIIYIKSKKGNYRTLSFDKEILKYFSIDNINHLYLNNLDIVLEKTVDNNKYEEYFIKTKLIKIVEVLCKKMVKK